MLKMSLEEKLHRILNKVTLSSEDRQSYTSDAEAIWNHIIQRMKENDRDFSNYFHGTSLTGSYMDDVKINLPDEFDIHIKLQLPVALSATKISSSPGHLYLKCTTQLEKLTDATNIGNCINRQKLQSWIRQVLEKVFPDNCIILQFPGGHKYRVEYSERVRGFAVAHTFTATDVSNAKREISFDFVPAFEFNRQQWVSNKSYPLGAPGERWFAVPSAKDEKYEFMICAPHLERELLKNNMNLKNALRLLKAVKDNENIWQLKSYLIKTVFLWENERQSSYFWQQPMGVIVKHMLERLIDCLRYNKISFYWDEKLNLLDRMKPQNRAVYQEKLTDILRQLNNNRGDLEDIFGC